MKEMTQKSSEIFRKDGFISIRIPLIDRFQAQQIAAKLGQTPSQWLRSLIYQAIATHKV